MHISIDTNKVVTINLPELAFDRFQDANKYLLKISNELRKVFRENISEKIYVRAVTEHDCSFPVIRLKIGFNREDYEITLGYFEQGLFNFHKLVYDIDLLNLREIPTYGDQMSLEEFDEEVESDSIISYDGIGNYIVGNKMSDIEVKFSLDHPVFATGIVWFNK